MTDNRCDFGPSDEHLGCEPCDTDDLKVVRLRVTATGKDVLLELCGRHRLAIFDAALSSHEGGKE